MIATMLRDGCRASRPTWFRRGAHGRTTTAEDVAIGERPAAFATQPRRRTARASCAPGCTRLRPAWGGRGHGNGWETIAPRHARQRNARSTTPPRSRLEAIGEDLPWRRRGPLIRTDIAACVAVAVSVQRTQCLSGVQV